jgi:hypothetical protein
MPKVSQPHPPLWLRIARFPVTRLLLLGGVLFLMIALSTKIMTALASTPLASLAAVAALAGLAMALYVGFVRLVERRPTTELALRGHGGELATGLLLGAGLYTACVLVLMLLGIYRIDGLNPWAFMLPALAMALSSGILEELLFRGVLFRIVEETCGSWVSIAVSSFVFGFLHLVNPAATVIGALFISLEAGLLLAAAYMLTRRLWMGIGFHIAWNYTQSGIFSGIVSGSDSDPGLVRSAVDGPTALTGGSFGLEASLVAFLLCTATGVLLLAKAIRRGHLVPASWPR